MKEEMNFPAAAAQQRQQFEHPDVPEQRIARRASQCNRPAHGVETRRGAVRGVFDTGDFAVAQQPEIPMFAREAIASDLAAELHAAEIGFAQAGRKEKERRQDRLRLHQLGVPIERKPGRSLFEALQQRIDKLGQQQTSHSAHGHFDKRSADIQETDPN